MAHINSLSDEIMTEILRISVFESNPRSLPSDIATLLSLLMVNKKWNSLVLPMLYSHVRITNVDKARLFIETLSQRNSSHGALVKSLRFSLLNLPPDGANGLENCIFPNLTILEIVPQMCRYTHHSGTYELQELTCHGRGCQEVIDRHSRSLKFLKLRIHLSNKGYSCGTVPSLPLLCLRTLDLEYSRATFHIMQALSSRLPSVTHLKLAVGPKSMGQRALRSYRKGLVYFLSELGKQVKILELTLANGASTVLDRFTWASLTSLESFLYCGYELLTWDKNDFCDLLQTLVRFRIVCARNMPVEFPRRIRRILEKPGTFPKLAVIPSLEFRRFEFGTMASKATEQIHEETRAVRNAARSVLAGRDLHGDLQATAFSDGDPLSRLHEICG